MSKYCCHACNQLCPFPAILADTLPDVSKKCSDQSFFPMQALEVLELRDRAAALEEAAASARARMAAASDDVHRLERAALALEERLAAAQQYAPTWLLQINVSTRACEPRCWGLMTV